MRVLLTGAAGFIGYHVAEALLARGQAVIGLDNLNPYYDVRLKEARLDRLAALIETCLPLLAGSQPLFQPAARLGEYANALLPGCDGILL